MIDPRMLGLRLPETIAGLFDQLESWGWTDIYSDGISGGSLFDIMYLVACNGTAVIIESELSTNPECGKHARRYVTTERKYLDEAIEYLMQKRTGQSDHSTF